MNTITPPEIQERIQAHQAAMLAEVSPAAAKDLEATKAAAVKLETKVDFTVEAISRITTSVRDLGDKVARLELHEGLQSIAGDTSRLEAAALAEQIQWHERSDRYALARADATVLEIMKLRAISAAIPPAITALKEEISKIRAGIKSLAADSRIDLPKLLKRLHQESLDNPNGKLASHFEAGRLEF